MAVDPRTAQLVEAERQRRMAERTIEELRAGADATPVEEGTQPTPGQWIHIFLGKSAPGRIEMIAAMFIALEVATQCKFMHGEEA
jgi:hypothetical protein